MDMNRIEEQARYYQNLPLRDRSVKAEGISYGITLVKKESYMYLLYLHILKNIIYPEKICT